MNKILSIAAIVALATTFSFAQGNKSGTRIGFSLYDYSSGNSQVDKYIDMGYGFGAGWVYKLPITGSLSLASEANFLYRQLFSMAVSGNSGSVTEFAMSFPFMFQLMPTEGGSFYLAAGIQVDFPLFSEMTVNGTTVDNDARKTIDLGIPLGAGFLLNPNFGIDFRVVIGIVGPDKDTSETSLNQYGGGVTYYY